MKIIFAFLGCCFIGVFCYAIFAEEKGGTIESKTKKTPFENEKKIDSVLNGKAISLATKIKPSRTQNEIEKICKDFAQLIQENPKQQLELQKIIIKVLQEKYNEYNNILEKNLASVNLEQLTSLKKEFNNKRPEALKELCEGESWLGYLGGFFIGSGNEVESNKKSSYFFSCIVTIRDVFV